MFTKLTNGNDLYMNEKYEGDISSLIRKDTTDNGQHPYLIVVTCSDSRVTPELIFNASIGDFFTIRVAGNVILEGEKASIEYAYEHLHCENLLILGHTSCGAVGSALKAKEKTGNIIVDVIKNVIGSELDSYKACLLNIENSKKEVLKQFPRMNVIKGIYDIESGKVAFIN